MIVLKFFIKKEIFFIKQKLNPILKKLGIQTAFDQNLADFSGMSSAEKLFISNVCFFFLRIIEMFLKNEMQNIKFVCR